MSINLGNDCTNALHELRGNPHFDRFIDAFGILAQNMTLSAMNAEVSLRVDSSAYARGFYHIWQAMKAAYAGQHVSQVRPAALPRGKRDTSTRSELEALTDAQ